MLKSKSSGVIEESVWKENRRKSRERKVHRGYVGVKYKKSEVISFPGRMGPRMTDSEIRVWTYIIVSGSTGFFWREVTFRPKDLSVTPN